MASFKVSGLIRIIQALNHYLLIILTWLG